MGKIERRFMATYVDAAEPSTSAELYELLGEDLEELNTELGPQVDKKKNILGRNTINISSYEPSASVEPYYAEKGSKLYARLKRIYDERLVLDDLKSSVVEVDLSSADIGTEFDAYREVVVLEVVSFGGDTTGLQIPFNMHYTNERVKGKFDVDTKKFTPATTDPEG
jgi:hypothetical protein